MTEFSLLVRRLELKTEYELLVQGNEAPIKVPKNRKGLTPDTAKWFLNSGVIANTYSPKVYNVVQICEEFLS